MPAKYYLLTNADVCVKQLNGVQHLVEVQVKSAQRLHHYSIAYIDNLMNLSLFEPMLLPTTVQMLHETNTVIYELLVVPLSAFFALLVQLMFLIRCYWYCHQLNLVSQPLLEKDERANKKWDRKKKNQIKECTIVSQYLKIKCNIMDNFFFLDFELSIMKQFYAVNYLKWLPRYLD